MAVVPDARRATFERPAWSASLGPSLMAFRARVREEGRRLYRDLPWRRTHDPYGIWLSEVMLQQTQVSRVEGRWEAWLARFPRVEDLAAAQSADVLALWQGMGYNRRAIALWKAARQVMDAGGVFPRETERLLELPGVGPATAAGIRAFAFDLPGTYLETNVRSVFLHEFFPGVQSVSDRELTPLVKATCPPDDADPSDDPRSWYYALLDYGAHLKRTTTNPSRRSAGHGRQSAFEGSRRQKRAELVRLLLAGRDEGALSTTTLARRLNEVERAAGRAELDAGQVEGLLGGLAAEGLCRRGASGWSA